MAKNSRKMAYFWPLILCLRGILGKKRPAISLLICLQRGVKGMTNAELNPIKEGKNKRKRRRKRRKK